MGFGELAQAMERGRQLAASRLRDDLEKRKHLEAVYGLDYCRRRYPEVYSTQDFEPIPSGFLVPLDRTV